MATLTSVVTSTSDEPSISRSNVIPFPSLERAARRLDQIHRDLAKPRAELRQAHGDLSDCAAKLSRSIERFEAITEELRREAERSLVIAADAERLEQAILNGAILDGNIALLLG